MKNVNSLSLHLSLSWGKFTKWANHQQKVLSLNFREDVWHIPWNRINWGDKPPVFGHYFSIFSGLWLLHSIRINAQIGAGHNGEMFHRFGGVGHAGGGSFHTFQLKIPSNNPVVLWQMGRESPLAVLVDGWLKSEISEIKKGKGAKSLR